MRLINNCNADLQLSNGKPSIPPGGIIDISCSSLSNDTRIRNLILSGHLVMDEADGNCAAARALMQIVGQKDNMLDSKGREIANVVLRGQMLDYSGYAKVNRNLVKVANANGIDMLVDPVDDKHPKLIGDDLRNFSHYKNWRGRCWATIDSVVPNMSLAKLARKRVLYTTVETSTLPLSMRENFHSYDKVWTTSKFCSDVIQHETGVNASVLPGLVDERIWTHAGEKKQFVPKLKSFIFVSVFNWGYRKAPDAMLHSYFRHFSGNDDVSLLLVARFKRHSSSAHGVRDEVEEIASQYSGNNLPHVARFSKEVDDMELASIYRASNCFVLSSRGEGYGLPHMESLMCGIPVIATRYGGYMDVLNDSNSKLVDFDSFKKVPMGATGVSYWDGQLMLDLTSDAFIDSFGYAMREVYERYSHYKNIAINAREYMISKVGSSSVALKLKGLMEEIK